MQPDHLLGIRVTGEEITHLLDRVGIQLFDADDGEVTRTRKLKRNVIEERYAPVIDAIYAGQASVVMKARVVYETGDEGIMERELRIRRVI